MMARIQDFAGALMNFFLIIFFLSSHLLYGASLKKITIGLDWFLSIQHMPFFIAKKMGFFKDQKLDVEYRSFLQSSEALKLLSCNKLNYALCYEPQLYFYTQKGFNIEWVATLIDEPLDCIVSYFPIEKEHLKGKKIAHCSSSSGVTFKSIQHILKKFDLKESDVELVYTKGNLVISFLTNQVDIAFNIWKCYGLLQIKKYKPHVYVVSLQDFGIPKYASLILVGQSANSLTTLETNKKIRAALSKAVSFIKKNPKKAYALLIEDHPELDNELNREAWKSFYTLFCDPKIQLTGEIKKFITE
jgi:putative hydroxymethylpyrimidine transport system substrate-binding protein